MSNYEITKTNEIIVTQTFNIGKPVEILEGVEQPNMENLTANVSEVLGILKACIVDNVKEDKSIDDILDEYTKFSILKMIGVTSYPVIKKDDKLIGIK